MAKSDNDQPGRFAEELALIGEILDGSVPHWQRFVERYSGLIYSVIRRQLFAEDEDEVRGAFADVLADLHGGKLAEYKGRAELSTWLIVVARGKALDYLRSRDGRRTLPASYEELSDLDKEVFRLYHTEGLSFEAVIMTLKQAGTDVTSEELADSVLRIESRVDRHYLRRLESNSRARSLGVVSGRMLDFMAEMRHRLDQAHGEAPDQILIRKEAAEQAQALRRYIDQLSEEERQVLLLRYERDWTARRIADELGLGSQRRVYTILDRAVRKLRKLFGDK